MMKKVAIAAMMAVIIVAFLSAPTLAYASPDTQPLSTASPRDWSKYAPDGQLDPEKVTADSAILIDAKTGKVLFKKDENAPRYPASTTKIMTCLLALENCKDIKNTKVTVGDIPKADLASDSDHIGFKKGEILTMEQLLYCLMVKSANDAADAIAIDIAGSIDKFVDMMNAKAQELGMSGTHYTCTNGLTNDTNHVTTAADMAKLATVAMQNATFAKIVGTAHYTLPATNMRSKKTTMDNTNWLIRDDQPDWSYAYAKGIKTGSTSMAGNALISAAQKGNVSLIGVVLHDDPRTKLWSDSITMYEYGFHFYDTVDLAGLINNESFSADIKDASGDDPGMGKLSLLLKPQTDHAFITDTTDKVSQIKGDPASLVTSQVSYSKDTAPVKRNDVVGTVTFSYNGEPVLTCDLLASRDVSAATPAPSPSAIASANSGKTSGDTLTPGASAGNTGAPLAGKGVGSFVILAGVIVLILLLALITIRLVNMQRRKSKYRQYSYRQGNGTRLRR